MFVNGDLKGKFIMDRNLGARDTKFAADGKGNLHFNYGRNTPIAGSLTGSALNAYVGRADVKWILGSGIGPVAMFVAVSNPMIKYHATSISGNWCDGVDSEVYVWNDYETNHENNDKSLFDPAPYGWKVTPNGTWDGFHTNWTPDTSHLGMTDWDSENIGRWYPRGDGDVEPFAFYPATGYRNANTLTMSGYSTYGFSWSSTPASVTNSYFFEMSAGSARPSFSYGRGRTMAIRCVQHNE